MDGSDERTAAWSSARIRRSHGPARERLAVASSAQGARRRAAFGTGAAAWCERPDSGGPRDREQSLLDSLDTSRIEQSSVSNRSNGSRAAEPAPAPRRGRRPLARARVRGWDAAGKGGAIRRVTAALDPRVRVVARRANDGNARATICGGSGPVVPAGRG